MLCLFFGGLVTLTSGFMVVNMMLFPVTKTIALFWVALTALVLAPPILIAGFRLLLNMPNKHGGLFSPFTLRGMAVINGLLGGIILTLGVQDSDPSGMYGGLSFLLTTQGAFILANKRAKT